jgi:ubiquitin carboxyl-terminal hydrolase 48
MWTDIGSGDSLDVSDMLTALRTLRGGVGFSSFRMEDAHDAARMIVEMLAESTRSAAGLSLVDNIVTTEVRHTRRCILCETSSPVIARDRELMVPIVAPAVGSDVTSLYDCLRELREPEHIADYACAECDGKTQATSTSLVVTPAELIMIVLKRFDAGGNKITTPVDIPLILDMQRATGNAALATNYQLIGVAHHQGSTKDSGHYVAQFFHDIHGEWVEANDQAVTTSAPPANSSTAYVLLYQRVAL